MHTLANLPSIAFKKKSTPSAKVKSEHSSGHSSSYIHREAAKGMQGASQPLPYLDRLQQAFGRHDLRQVRAYMGVNAKAANEAIGAKAYATGNKIVFADQNPSLHTVAHEAAHVVQQQAGVQLKGGIDTVGDQYERQADQVANAIVQGKSVENLFDNYGVKINTSFNTQTKSLNYPLSIQRTLAPLNERRQTTNRQGQPITRRYSHIIPNNNWSVLQPNLGVEFLLHSIKIDHRSKRLFELSNPNVAFVGVYNLPENKLYLHPLVPWNAHYQTNDFSLWFWQKKEFEDANNPNFLSPIEHNPNSSNLNTSHTQIIRKYNPQLRWHVKEERHSAINNHIGFAVIKNGGRNGEHIFSGQSGTLNTVIASNAAITNDKKFLYPENEIQNEDAYLPIDGVSFLMHGLYITMPNEFSLEEQWKRRSYRLLGS